MPVPKHICIKKSENISERASDTTTTFVAGPTQIKNLMATMGTVSAFVKYIQGRAGD